MSNLWLEGARIFAMYALPGTVAVVTVALFIRVLDRMKRLEKKLEASKETFRLETASLSKSVNGLQKEFQDRPAEPAIEQGQALEANSTTRAKALKMRRLGRSVEEIAEGLRLPKGDVMLLLKVHDIVLQTFEPKQEILNGAAN